MGDFLFHYVSKLWCSYNSFRCICLKTQDRHLLSTAGLYVIVVLPTTSCSHEHAVDDDSANDEHAE